MHFFSIKNSSKSATFLFILFSIFTANAFAQDIQEYPANLVRKEQAINKLSDRLPAVARKHGKSPEELRRLLLEDETLFLDPNDRLLYIDPARNQELDVYSANSPSVSEAAPFPYSQTFALHSRPGSSRVIYLDFNGHVTSGTQWNNSFTGGQAINSAPFSIDGDPNTFNQQEQDAIQYIWQRVAEDYAPFDVDVTTEDPGDAAIIRSNAADTLFGTRAVISPTNFTGSALGGIAFLGVFNAIGTSFKPAFVMSSGLGNSEKSIAEAVSHEVGHNFNLDHDGTASTGYYLGHGDWAPIMGAGYYRSVSQWSRGEYPGANQFQDDLALIQNYGAALIADDHANETAGATVLGSTINVSGLITNRNDVDVFQFATGTGNVTININPAVLGANLDIQAKISNAQGVVLATIDPAGLSASFNQFLTAGVYYLTIDGVGAGTLASGYSDYASIGQYRITGTLSTAGEPPPSTVMLVNSITMVINAQHRGQATITVRNTNGTPVPNVMVTGFWTGLAIGTENEMTDQNGVITFTSRENWKPGTYTFTVINLSAPSYTYNPALNVETSDSITQCFLSECG